MEVIVLDRTTVIAFSPMSVTSSRQRDFFQTAQALSRVLLQILILNTVITLTNSTMLQINSNYRSARLTPQGKYLPGFVMNMGLRQEVLKKKGSVYFTASDLLKSLRQEQDLNTIVQQIQKKDNLQFDNSL